MTYRRHHVGIYGGHVHVGPDHKELALEGRGMGQGCTTDAEEGAVLPSTGATHKSPRWCVATPAILNRICTVESKHLQALLGSTRTPS